MSTATKSPRKSTSSKPPVKAKPATPTLRADVDRVKVARAAERIAALLKASGHLRPTCEDVDTPLINRVIENAQEALALLTTPETRPDIEARHEWHDPISHESSILRDLNELQDRITAAATLIDPDNKGVDRGLADDEFCCLVDQNIRPAWRVTVDAVQSCKSLRQSLDDTCGDIIYSDAKQLVERLCGTSRCALGRIVEELAPATTEFQDQCLRLIVAYRAAGRNTEEREFIIKRFQEHVAGVK